MSRATTIQTQRKMSISRRERMVKNNTSNSTTLSGSHTDRRVSREFLGSRESLYRLVDLVDYLFDGVIG